MSTTRQVGMAEGAIPFTAVDGFAVRYRIDDLDEFDRFLAMMMAMDAEYLKTRSERARQAAEENARLAKEEAAKEAANPKPKRPPKALTKPEGG